jgi:hypothetical protein
MSSGDAAHRARKEPHPGRRPRRAGRTPARGFAAVPSRPCSTAR